MVDEFLVTNIDQVDKYQCEYHDKTEIRTNSETENYITNHKRFS